MLQRKKKTTRQTKQNNDNDNNKKPETDREMRMFFSLDREDHSKKIPFKLRVEG